MSAPITAATGDVLAVVAMLSENSETQLEDLEAGIALVREDLGQVVLLLDEALQPDRLAEITARSYRHPNGFAKIVLHDAADVMTDVSVRLHVWPAENEYPDFDDVPRRDTCPHSHRWEFASTVVAGEGLLVEEFNEAAMGIHHEKLHFDPSTGPSLRGVGSTFLSSREIYVRDRSDDIYSCGTDVVHTVGPIDSGMTATVVLQGPETEPFAVVYRRRDAPPDPGRASLSVAIVEELIVGVRARLLESAARPEQT